MPSASQNCRFLTPSTPAAKLKSMFRRAFWIQRAGIALFLVASLAAGSIALPHADEAADTQCTPVMVAHDESAHYIGAAHTPSPGHAGHCFLCHSLRTFYPTFIRFQQHHDTPLTERLHLAPIDRASIGEWTLVPGRAPPA